LDDEQRYTISELANSANVSVRTVRYYIGEGLLPPAVNAGAGSYYTGNHLDRLRLIAKMKEGYLPLREIRKQLADLDGEVIKHFANQEIQEAAGVVPPAPQAPAFHATAHRGATAEALGFIAGREDIRPSPPEPQSTGTAVEYIANVLKGVSTRRRTPWTYAKLEVPPTPIPEPDTEPEQPSQIAAAEVSVADTAVWRRITISDSAELLIREEMYGRRRDKVDWLVDWARKVLS
jgi:DNA-binding transcriptional MerR regulator